VGWADPSRNPGDPPAGFWKKKKKNPGFLCGPGGAAFLEWGPILPAGPKGDWGGGPQKDRCGCGDPIFFFSCGGDPPLFGGRCAPPDFFFGKARGVAFFFVGHCFFVSYRGFLGGGGSIFWEKKTGIIFSPPPGGLAPRCFVPMCVGDAPVEKIPLLFFKKKNTVFGGEGVFIPVKPGAKKKKKKRGWGILIGGLKKKGAGQGSGGGLALKVAPEKYKRERNFNVLSVTSPNCGEKKGCDPETPVFTTKGRGGGTRGGVGVGGHKEKGEISPARQKKKLTAQGPERKTEGGSLIFHRVGRSQKGFGGGPTAGKGPKRGFFLPPPNLGFVL